MVRLVLAVNSSSLSRKGASMTMVACRTRESALPRLRELTFALIDADKYESELVSFFHCSPELFAIENNGKFIQTNQAWTRLFGWTSEDMDQQFVMNFVHPDDRAYTQKIMDTLVVGDLVKFKNRCQTKAGTYIDLEWSTTKRNNGMIYAIARPCGINEGDKCPLELR